MLFFFKIGEFGNRYGWVDCGYKGIGLLGIGLLIIVKEKRVIRILFVKSSLGYRVSI